MILEDVFRQQRFAAARLRRHRRDHDAVADDDLRIAHEEVVRNGKKIERRQIACLLSLVRNAADQNLHELGRFPVVEPRRQAPRQVIPFREIAHDGALHVVVLEDFFEEIGDLVHVIRDEPDELLEPAMFFARDLPVKDVVEEELRHHRRDHDVDLAPGQMHEHALELADLARHVKPHAPGILVDCPPCHARW